VNVNAIKAIALMLTQIKNIEKPEFFTKNIMIFAFLQTKRKM
jgi:hypothetical protein